MLDFPAAPANGQKYPAVPTAGVPQYTWDGEKWTMAVAAAPGVIASDTPPPNAVDGTMWFESDTGLLYILYNDGNSRQWVIAAPQPDFSAYASKTYVDAAIAASAAASASAHGEVKLEYVSPTQLRLRGYNGNAIKVGGVVYKITTPLTINNAGLSPNTTYTLELMISGSVPVLNWAQVAAPHGPDANGIEVMTNNPDRTLIGLVRTNASTQFANTDTQRFVRSWFNDRSIVGFNALGGNSGITNTSPAELPGAYRVEFVSWAGENVSYSATGTWNASAASMAAALFVSFDGAAPRLSGVQYPTAAGGGYNMPVAAAGSRSDLAEGYHYASMFAQIGGTGTATFTGGAAVGACAISIQTTGR